MFMMINEPLFKEPLTLYTLNCFVKRTLSSLRAETDAEKLSNQEKCWQGR